MFVELSGEVFKVLKKEADGNWLISYENPSSPVFVMEKEMNRMNRIEPPAENQELYADRADTRLAEAARNGSGTSGG